MLPKKAALGLARERCTQYIFRTYADLILVGFSHHIYRKLLPKRKATNLKKMEKNCSENFQRHFSDISNLMTILNRKLIIIDNRKSKKCVRNQFLPKIGIRKLEKVVKSENWTKVGIRNLVKLVKSQILAKIVTENRFYTKFKFVKINTVCNNSLLQWRLLACLF